MKHVMMCSNTVRLLSESLCLQVYHVSRKCWESKSMLLISTRRHLG